MSNPSQQSLAFYGDRKALLFCDGASSGNPGDSGIGAVLDLDGQRATISEFIGEATNNIAEYSALIRGVEEALRRGAREIEIRADSELIVRQITGQYRVKQPHLQALHRKALSLLKQFSSYTISHIPREDNSEADRLARQAVRSRK